MKSQFITDLVISLVDEDKIWLLHEPLVYDSELLDCTVTVPVGFQTDLASVPRVPVLYVKWGNRAHREAVIHDYLYRIDSIPVVTFDQANNVFKEAMVARGKTKDIYEGMYKGVCLGGKSSYHRKYVEDKLI
jgi:hypothetical protein